MEGLQRMKELFDLIIKGNIFLTLKINLYILRHRSSTRGSPGPFEWVVDICVNKKFMKNTTTHCRRTSAAIFEAQSGCCSGPYPVSTRLIV